MNRALRRLIFVVAMGLVLGAGIHLAVVLALPALGTSSAYQRFVAAHPAGGTAGLAPPQADPAAEMKACAYDLAAGPVRIRAPVRDLVESVSIHARTGGVIYALSDRGASGGAIDLILMTQRQLDEAQAADDPDQPSQDLRVLVPEARGLAAVRVVVPFPSRRPEARALAEGLTCGPAT